MNGTYLGVSLINLLGHLPLLGVTSAIDILGVSALNGANSHKEVYDKIKLYANLFVLFIKASVSYLFLYNTLKVFKLVKTCILILILLQIYILIN